MQDLSIALDGSFRILQLYGCVQLSLGTAYSVLPALDVTAETGLGIQMVRVSGGEYNLIADRGNTLNITDEQKKFEGSNAKAANSKSLALGLRVSF